MRLVTATLLALLATASGRAQDTQVVIGCPGVTLLLKCSPSPYIYRASVPIKVYDIADNTLSRPDIVSTDSLAAFGERSLVVPKSLLTDAQILGEYPATRFGLDSVYVDGGRRRASLFPVKGRPDVVRLNPYGDTRSRVSPEGDSVYVHYLYWPRDRDVLHFIHYSRGFTAVAIPARMRWRLRGTDPAVAPNVSEAASAVSVGVMYSLRMAQRSYRFEAGAAEPIVSTGGTRGFGLMLGVSVEELSASNTSSRSGRFVGRSQKTVVLSPGLGVQMGHGSFSLGLYGGIGVAPFSGGGAWDYQWAPWAGVGVSSKLDFGFF